MPVKKLKPVSPGQRGMSVLKFDAISRRQPEKSLTKPLSKTAGRGGQDKHICVRRRGGGHKRRYRLVDFKRQDKFNIPAKVAQIEYDPNRTALIMLVNYRDGEKRYHLAPENIKINDNIIAGEKVKIKIGNRLPFKNIPDGFNIYNLEIKPGQGGKLVRSAGASARLVSIEGKIAQIEMPSGEIRAFNKECLATIGIISNIDHSHVSIGKAGRSRHMGKRPKVRGKAMNPVDHPHGGGEGGTSIGLKHPKTPWGMPTLGFKTRKRQKYSDKLILKSRRKKKKR